MKIRKGQQQEPTKNSKKSKKLLTNPKKYDIIKEKKGKGSEQNG